MGNTTSPSTTPPSESVHPHACGEHLIDDEGVTVKTGSSPRVWGTLTDVITTNAAQRFIPTRVGNTRGPWIQFILFAVHPHACGEHVDLCFCIRNCSGSSPRVWGTLCAHTRIHPVIRFIPTRVGNTGLSPVPAGNTAVHPHACGEHSKSDAAKAEMPGSSPRVWGTQP